MKQIISLNGEWQVVGFNPGQANWALTGSLTPEGAVSIEGHVPGEVHVDLFREGIIPDPYYGMNAEQAQWVEDKEWWYKREFEVDEDFLSKRAFLEFDGLDTYATIYLNGEEIGRSENMFIPHRFNITGKVHIGRNTVAVKFDPAAKVLEGTDYSNLFGCFDTPRVNARKMQCAFGWDWTHRFVGAGIWRGARVVSYSEVSIADVHITPEIEGGYASAWISIEVENHTHEDIDVTASVVVALGENRETIEVTDTITPFGGVIEAVIRIEEPQLWWPNGFGEQTLYTCMVGLEAGGEVHDVTEQKFGVRTVKIVERDKQGGNVFTVMINNQEVFCKGGNWIPADHFVSNVTPDRYRELIQLAKDANFNMLRIWGGGIYESSAFYEACDEMGIMVWQDFMFSCATYRDDEEFCREIARETATAVKLLRNYPSIVIWCGNNECEMKHSPDAEWSGKKLFWETIPNVLKSLDNTRPYRQCSPFGGEHGNDSAVGDRHYSSWFTAYQGDYTKWRHYIEEENGLFISEFVTQGPPMVESIREFIPEDKLFPPTNEVWEYHNKNNPHSSRVDKSTHQQILVSFIEKMMGSSETVEQFAAYGGILQGEFIKAEFEHYRREKWKISGGLMWMYNDCWPAVDWSIVDYYLRPKAAYYYAKRACAPIIISFKQLEDTVQLYVTSDERLTGVDGTLHVGVYTFGARDMATQEIPVKLAANTSQAFWESNSIDELLPDPANQCLIAFLNVGDKTITKNTYFALPFKEMQFLQPKLLVGREQFAETRHQIIVSSDDYARNVAIENLPANARPSDNFFDVIPGELHIVNIDNLTVEQANELKLRVWAK